MSSATENVFNGQTKLGILGGGQLGKMLALAGANWHLDLWALDETDTYPAAPYCRHFVAGSFADEAAVLQFGRQVDVLTIEIEHVHTGALRQLEAEGKRVYPSSAVLEIIQDKGRQKQFYAAHHLPTAPFQLFDDASAVRQALADGSLGYPFVQKSRTDGYDGRGVAIVREAADLPKLLPGACVVEQLADIHKELAVIVARNERGEARAFPVVEMAFNPEANLVEFLLAPAQIPAAVAEAATQLALRTAAALQVQGLLAVELFWNQSGELWVNEVAPRTHNSGHHTIESCYTSQFEQQLRAVLNLPLGDTSQLKPAVMVNLLGEPGHHGPVRYAGIDAVLAKPGVYLHLYGKTTTKPFRKMGHATILADTPSEAIATARWVQQTLRVVSA